MKKGIKLTSKTAQENDEDKVDQDMPNRVKLCSCHDFNQDVYTSRVGGR